MSQHPVVPEPVPPTTSVLWDMLDGPMPRGLLGVGDPDVHHLDGVWTMFLGGFSSTFRNRLYRATLPAGAALGEACWRVDRGRRGWVGALTEDPPRRAWDAAGMHTPSHVPASGGRPARIYYTGRANARHYGPGSRYSIGVLERQGDRWHRRPDPVVEGDGGRPSVLEPTVVDTGAGLRMWYQANPHEVGPGEQPDYELRCSDSTDGLSWSEPTTFSGSADGFFDNAVVRWGSGWLMVLARGSNLHGTRPFPSQGLWATTSDQPGSLLSEWAPLRRLLDTSEPGTPDWCGAGTYGPAVAIDEEGRSVVLTSGTRATPPWPRLALQRLRARRRIPVPSPYQLTTGQLALPLPPAPSSAPPDPTTAP